MKKLLLLIGVGTLGCAWLVHLARAPADASVPRDQPSPAHRQLWEAAGTRPTLVRQPVEHGVASNERAMRTDSQLLLCQYAGVPGGECVRGTDCSVPGACEYKNWKEAPAVPWATFAQGEYVGHPRTPHVPEYRLRPDDQIEMIYRVTREQTHGPYRLNVGDEIRIESFADEKLNRELIVQPDGTITLWMLGQVRATGRTVSELRDLLEERYKRFYQMPTINVTPLRVNTKLEDLRATVDSRFGQGGQSRLVRVTPEGSIALPALGSVSAQGLTLDELGREINERYRLEIEGIEVTPVLNQRAPRYVFVLGEVRTPGRYTLEGPTTAMQAIALAGGWNVGARLQQIVIFRRGDDWRLMGTLLDLQHTLWGNQPCPADEIWLNDSDLVIVPKSKILLMDDFINLVFTRGLYGVVPFSTSYAFNGFSQL